MIEVRNLSKKFDDLCVLKDVNVRIEKGEIISIIGPSGTGKSTFLRCLNLLETPSGGEILINEDNILAKDTNIPKLRQKMGMVFQSFNLFMHLNVLQNLTISPIKVLKKSKNEAEERAKELLKMVGLSDKAYSLPEELSGGQKQRVAIARCLAMEPDIILFDEPTSALDPTMVSEVLSVIQALAKQGMTMLIVTHEMEFAKEISNRVFYMDEGIIYEDGPPDQIFNKPQKEKTYNFINRIKSFSFHIKNEDYDFIQLRSSIEEFCRKHLIEKEKSQNIIQIIEESLIQISQVESLTSTNIQLSFNEKQKESTIFIEKKDCKSNPFDEENAEDNISLMILKNICSKIEIEHNDQILKVRYKY